MAHSITKSTNRYYKYLNHQVIYVTDIYSNIHTGYPEAINIAIEEIPIEKIRDNKLESIIND